VSSVKLVTVDVSGELNVGGLAGANIGGIVQNCEVSGSVSGNSGLGMVLGANYEFGTVQGCQANGTVTGTGSYIGGIVGSNYATVTNGNKSYAAVQGNGNVGGIVGENYTENGKVIGNQVYGGVRGQFYVGGVVGRNHSNTTTMPVVSGNTFSQAGTGQVWGIGSPQSNNGCTAQP
jgi:hypothetical protein